MEGEPSCTATTTPEVAPSSSRRESSEKAMHEASGTCTWLQALSHTVTSYITCDC